MDFFMFCRRMEFIQDSNHSCAPKMAHLICLLKLGGYRSSCSLQRWILMDRLFVKTLLWTFPQQTFQNPISFDPYTRVYFWESKNRPILYWTGKQQSNFVRQQLLVVLGTFRTKYVRCGGKVKASEYGLGRPWTGTPGAGAGDSEERPPEAREQQHTTGLPERRSARCNQNSAKGEDNCEVLWKRRVTLFGRLVLRLDSINFDRICGSYGI